MHKYIVRLYFLVGILVCLLEPLFGCVLSQRFNSVGWDFVCELLYWSLVICIAISIYLFYMVFKLTTKITSKIEHNFFKITSVILCLTGIAVLTFFIRSASH